MLTNGLIIETHADREAMSRAAAAHAAEAIRDYILEKNGVRLIVATGTSQIDFLNALTSEPEIEWSRVELFHLDEYVGLPITHRASFRRYLLERLIRKVGIRNYHLLDGEKNPEQAAKDIGALLAARPADIAFVGIGENGHLAFNDPPADFTTDDPYIIVTLDEACRQQQVGEKWFSSIDDVPTQAISMSVRQILKTAEILAIVPDARKAKAVQACVEGPVTPMAPASILQTHGDTTLYLDLDSAELLMKPR